MAAVANVRTVEDARALLSKLEKQEADVTSELDQLLEQQAHMDVRMASFRQMMPTLRSLYQDSGELCEAVTRASGLAESVSSKVRLLDQAKSRVYAAMKRVDDVIDLKDCADGFQYAMNSGDYEKAAAHIHRYLTLDESMLLEGEAADSAKEGSSTVSGSFSVLKENEGKLKVLVRQRFREAADSDKKTDIERFARLFPLLNLHEEGLDLYASHLCSKMKSFADDGLAKSNQTTGNRVGVVYADTLTMLYESTARLLEQHTPLVETCYGPDWIPALIRKIQVECDRQVARIVQQLQDERMLDHKVQTVSVALKAKTPAGAIRPDVLELDTLLIELSLCSSRTELYFRFIQKKANVELSSGHQQRGTTELVRGSKTNLLIQEMIGKYIMLENYFMKESLRKAVEIDSCSQDGLTSSMADDIFFVVQKCTRRAFASTNVDGACAMLNNASYLLLTDYLELLRARLKASLPSAGIDFSGMLQSKLQSTRPGGGDSEANKPSISVALNDMEVSIENLSKLTKELQEECSKMADLLGEGAKMKLDSCLTEFNSVNTSFKDLRQTAVSKVVEVLVLPQLTTTLETYSSLPHTLTETEFSNYEVNDPFIQPLITATGTALADIKGRFIPAVYKLLLGDMIDCVVERLTAQVWKCSYNQLGGVQLDKDLRCLMGYLSTVCEWPVRDKFALLLQLATILSLETVGEMMEYWGDRAGPLVWRLTPMEVKKALRLRVDFDRDAIALLKLMDMTAT